MNDASITSLGQYAAVTAMKAALAYLEQRGQLKTADTGKLSERLRHHVKAALPAALDDAKAAIDCGMSDAASLTFAASMAAAGIAAAKEVCPQPEPTPEHHRTPMRNYNQLRRWADA